jgi:hypothetical protein
MPELEEGLRRFLEQWFSGLMEGLEGVGDSARTAILRACGKGCARSYTCEVFKQARAQGKDMEGFLAALAERFSGATYEILGPDAILVQYTECGCDLVVQGLVDSPLLCECSAHNLRDNFESALGIPVTVRLESSILAGADRCSLLVSLSRSV